MTKILSHSSCVIIEAEKSDEFLLGMYDETYPTEYFRGAINLIGGNYKKEDKSPLGILLREIKEEFSSNQKYVNQKEKGLRNVTGKWRPPLEIRSFANEEDIFLIKNEIISNIRPYKDYLWCSPFLMDKDRLDSLSSVFVSKVKQDIFELARRNLNGEKSIKNEGSAIICGIKDIVEGKFLCAWAAPCILSDYKNVNIPNPYNARVKPIGGPRNSILDYSNEFEYKAGI